MLSLSHKKLLPVCLMLLVAACADTDQEPATTANQWPAGLTTPITGATFSMQANHLPGPALEDRGRSHQGFDFGNGYSGRFLASDEPVVAVAAGEIVRIDHDYGEPAPEILEYWAELADSPGQVGAWALDRLRGRQVWIRH